MPKMKVILNFHETLVVSWCFRSGTEDVFIKCSSSDYFYCHLISTIRFNPGNIFNCCSLLPGPVSSEADYANVKANKMF